MRAAFRVLARLHRLDDEGWRRHANPWSGWTRALTLPVLAALIWWRAPLGLLFPPLLIALAVWIWLNPRLFPPIREADAWMSRAVLGERVWLERRARPIAKHYYRALPVILGIEIPALTVLGIGLWLHIAWPVIYGLTLAIVAKFWFLDRMVWLYDDTQQIDPT